MIILGLSALVMVFVDNTTWGMVALVGFGVTTIVWVLSAAVAAARSGFSFFSILWMSIKNLIRIVVEFLP